MTKKYVAITAGANGLGLITAKAFAARGDQVFVCDVSQDAISKLDNENIHAMACDISNADEVKQWFAVIAEKTQGGLDYLINNAGIAGPTGRVEDLSVDNFDPAIQVNINGTFYVTHYAVPLLRQKKSGSIVNISSTAGTFGYPLRSPYVASKWAVIGLTKTWAMELGADNISVNAICPGSLENPRMDGVIRAQAEATGVTAQQVRDEYTKQVSMRCFIDPQEIADLALYLCSKQGRKISGQIIAVDGNTESLATTL